MNYGKKAAEGTADWHFCYHYFVGYNLKLLGEIVGERGSFRVAARGGGTEDCDREKRWQDAT